MIRNTWYELDIKFKNGWSYNGEFLNGKTNGIGIIHYLNFSYKAECNCYTPETYFNDHFKLRSELSYNKTDLHSFFVIFLAK